MMKLLIHEQALTCSDSIKDILQQEEGLAEIVQLVGRVSGAEWSDYYWMNPLHGYCKLFTLQDSLAETDKLVLEVAKVGSWEASHLRFQWGLC